MSLWSAGTFLVLASGRNRVRRMGQRLRNPRYLVGSAVGALYLYSLFSHSFSPHGKSAGSGLGSAEMVFRALFLGFLLISVAWSWIFSAPVPSLRFSEAEVQWLFQAPLPRRALVHFQLLRSLVTTFFGAFVSTFLFSRTFGYHPAFVFFGAWLTLATLSFHRTATSLTRARFAQESPQALRRLSVLLVSALAALLFVTLAEARKLPGPPLANADLSEWLQFSHAVANLMPIRVLLFPLQGLLNVSVARSGRDFLAAVPWAVTVVGLHYLWILKIQVSFEDAALEAAARRARSLQTRGRGLERQAVKASPPWWKLRVPGPPALALTWKNLLGFQRSLGVRSVFRVALVLVGLGVGLGTLGPLGIGGAVLTAVVPASGLLLLLCTLLLPVTLRIDLRQDVAQLEVLKSLPLSGMQVLWAELLAPAVLLLGAEWSLLILCALCLTLLPRGTVTQALPLQTLALCGLLAAVAMPLITLSLLLVQNSAALMFPAWVQVDPSRPRGIEATGQRLLNLALTLLVFAVGVLPAVALGAVPFFTLRWLGWPNVGLLTGGLCGCAALAAELVLGSVLAGRLYDGLDATDP